MLGNDADRIMTTPMRTTVVTQNTARGPSMPAPRPANGASATREAGTIRLGPSSSGMIPGMAADPNMLPGMGTDPTMLPGMGTDPSMLPGMGALADMPTWMAALAGAAGGYFAGRMAAGKRGKKTKQTFALGGAVIGGLLLPRLRA